MNKGKEKQPKDKRQIYIPNTNKKSFANNVVKSSRYTWYNFLLINLYEQFRHVSNIYFLIVMIVNLTPGLNIYTPVSAVLPLALILLITMCKDGFEDFKRHQNDRKTNSRSVLILEGNRFSKHKASQMAVGDFIMVRQDEEIPADYVLLSSSEEEGMAFVKTMNLDGESNLKVKRSCPETYSTLKLKSNIKKEEEKKKGKIKTAHKNKEKEEEIMIESQRKNVNNNDNDNNSKNGQDKETKDKGGRVGDYNGEEYEADFEEDLRECGDLLEKWKGKIVCQLPSRLLADWAGIITMDFNKNEEFQKFAISTLIPSADNANVNLNVNEKKNEEGKEGKKEEGNENENKSVLPGNGVVDLSLNDSQLMLKGCTLKNTAWGVGVVVYCGKESKVQLNSQGAKSKISHLDKKMNFVVGILIVVNVLLVVTHGVLAYMLERSMSSSSHGYLYMDKVKSLRLFMNLLAALVFYSYLIPNSLFMSFEITRVFQAIFMEFDDEMDPGKERERKVQEKRRERKEKEKRMKNEKEKLTKRKVKTEKKIEGSRKKQRERKKKMEVDKKKRNKEMKKKFERKKKKFEKEKKEYEKWMDKEN